MHDDADVSPEEVYFIKIVSYVFIDNVVTGLTIRYNAVNKFGENFGFCVEMSNNV